MSTTEHIKLADFIKSIHRKLREEANTLGTEQAWEKHCANEENLEKYASAMQELALNHWEKNSQKNCKVSSRVFWIYSSCMEYFSIIEKYRQKEANVMKRCLKCIATELPVVSKVETNNKAINYKLLDVGSCYNPFDEFDMLDVVPIDIAPANKDVLKCDFLNVNICSETVIENQTVVQLTKGSFDIVVFSLLLEYFPSPEQRLKCCLKAYDVLKPEGILVIVTPDSNHVGSNAKIFKSWRYVLAKHGFIRVKYEKLPYIHGMVFRKAQHKLVAQRWAKIYESEGLFFQIHIPQDFTSEKPAKELEFCKNLDKDRWSCNTFLNQFESIVIE